MKTTTFISIVLALMVSVSAFAQKPDVTENFDINGIKIGSVINDSILRSEFGTPTREGFLDGNSDGTIWYNLNDDWYAAGGYSGSNLVIYGFSSPNV